MGEVHKQNGKEIMKLTRCKKHHWEWVNNTLAHYPELLCRKCKAIREMTDMIQNEDGTIIIKTKLLRKGMSEKILNQLKYVKS